MLDPVEEQPFYYDEPKIIAELLKKEWSLGPQNSPNVEYDPHGFYMSTRTGGIYVYRISGTNRISSIDYQAVHRDSYLGIRVSNPKRENHLRWCQEVYRILLSNRRHHPALGDYLFLEVTGERESNDLTSYYVTTFDVKMTRYNKPIRSAGFGDRINKAIDDLANNTTGD